MTRRSKVGCWC